METRLNNYVSKLEITITNITLLLHGALLLCNIMSIDNMNTIIIKINKC
jgi:hypothetical protein